MAENQRLTHFLQAGQTAVSNDLLQHYQTIGLTNDDLVVYLQIERLQNQGELATPEKLAAIMHVSESALTKRLQKLIQQQLVVLNGQSRQTETYDFTPMLQRLIAGQAAQQTTVGHTLSDQQLTRRDLLQQLETEFGHPISPMQSETVTHWLDQDHFDPTMISLAIREAVVNNVRNLRYIEKILVNWQQNNITTPAAAQAAKTQRQQRYTPNVTSDPGQSRTAKTPAVTIPLIKLTDT